MRAVDILVAARTRLTKYENWTTAALSNHSRSADGGRCFCSLGATVHEGGGMKDDDLVFNTVRETLDYELPEYTALAHLSYDFVCKTNEDTRRALTNLKLVSGLLTEAGFAAKSTLIAISYLQAAAKQMYGTHVVLVNDGPGRSHKNHAAVLAMFDLAIKNAKRRHINGRNYARLAPRQAV